MAKLCMMRYGCTLSFTHGNSAHMMTEAQKHNKTRNKGWTIATSRNLTNYLMRLDFTSVPGTPYAITLTIPARYMNYVSSTQFHTMLAAWIRHARRRYGLIHYYWIIEFTAQGTPHIHMTIWCINTTTVYNRHTQSHETIHLPPLITQTAMLTNWITICAKHDIPATLTAQNFRPIDNTPETWLAYTAKHATRGITHYQRRLDHMPQDWQTHPGAMWGHDRKLSHYQTDWIEIPMNADAFWILRRKIRHQLEQQAHYITDPVKRRKTITTTRRLLKHPLTSDEMKRKHYARTHGIPFLPQHAFTGIRAWLPPHIQQTLIHELTTNNTHTNNRQPLTGTPQSGQQHHTPFPTSS